MVKIGHIYIYINVESIKKCLINLQLLTEIIASLSLQRESDNKINEMQPFCIFFQQSQKVNDKNSL